MIVPGKVFADVGPIISSGLRIMKRIGWTRRVPLTVRPTAYPIPQPLGNIQPILQLVDVLPHRKEPLIRFSHFGEGIQERVGDIIDQPIVLFWIWRMSNMLVHVHMLKERR